jgi:hypothetical protein
MRLFLIDGIRGHLLIMMMLAHLSWQPGMDFLGVVHHAKIIGLYDAEFLVLMSGLLVGILFVRKFGTREALSRFLLHRLVKIYKYYVISAIPFLVLAFLGVLSREEEVLTGMSAAMSEVFLLINGGAYSDILPIYLYCFILLLIGSATVLRFGVPALLIPSGLIYLASLSDFSPGFFGLSGGFMAFDVAAWQFLFFLSFALGTQYERLVDWVNGLEEPLFLTFLAVSAAFLLLQRGVHEYPALFSVPADVSDNWERMHLHPLHLIRIFVVAGFFSLFLSRKTPWTRTAAEWLELYLKLPVVRYTGTFSIQMFVSHVFLMAVYQYFEKNLDFAGKTLLAISVMAIFLVLPVYLHRWKLARSAALIT